MREGEDDTARHVNTPREGIFNTLQQGDRDMIVSAVTITGERSLAAIKADGTYAQIYARYFGGAPAAAAASAPAPAASK